MFREKKLKHREVQELAKGHLKPSYMAPEIMHALVRVTQATVQARGKDTVQAQSSSVCGRPHPSGALWGSLSDCESGFYD